MANLPAGVSQFLLDPNYQPGPAGALEQGGFYAPPVTQLYRGGILAQPTTQLQTGWLDAMPESPLKGDWSTPGGEYKPNFIYPAWDLNEGGMQARPEFKMSSNMPGPVPAPMSQFSAPPLPQMDAPAPPSPDVMQDPTYQAPGPAPAPQANPGFEIGNLRMPGAAPQSSSQSPILGNSDAGMWGLIAAGLGILANTQGSYGSAAGPIGKGGLMGVQTYLQQREQNVQNLAQQQRIEIAKKEQAAREQEYASQAQLRGAQIDSMREEGEAAKAIGAALGGGSGPGAPVAPMIAPKPMPGQGTVLAPGVGTPGTPGGPPLPASTGGGVFDPNTYAQAAVAAFNKGSMKQGEKMLGLAKDMASLAQSGVHVTNTGSHQVAFKTLPGGGTQILGVFSIDLSPEQIAANVNKMVESQQKQAEIKYNTGASVPAIGGLTPQGMPIVNGAMGAQSTAPSGGTSSGGMGLTSPKSADEAKTAVIKQQTEGLIKQYEALQQSAPDTLMAIRTARQAYETAKPMLGSGAETRLQIAKFFNNNLGTNIASKEVASTEVLKAALFRQVMDNLKKMDAQPTKLQQDAMHAALGEIETDPGALPKFLDLTESIVRQRVSLHNGRVDQAVKKGVPSLFDMKITLPDSTKTVKRSGTYQGKRIIEYTDGSASYEDGTPVDIK